MTPTYESMVAELDTPALTHAHQQRRELIRRAAQLAIDHADAGRAMDPHHIEWARRFVAANPAIDLVGDGSPQPKELT